MVYRGKKYRVDLYVSLLLIMLFFLPAIIVATADDTIGKKESALSLGIEVPVGELEAVGSVIGSGGCTGTLITDNLVLTAAHCFCNSAGNCINRGHFTLHDVRPVNNPAVRQDITIQGDVRIHPEYEQRGWQREDYAVIELDTPVSQLALVNPITVEEPWNVPFTKEILTMVGFGLTGTDCKSASKGKMKMDVPVDVSGWGGISFKTDRLHSCPGDSGGPVLNTNGHVVGVASWGDSSQSVSVYRPTSYAYNWIYGLHTPRWTSCSWMPVETAGMNSHDQIQLCPDGSYLTALDVDSDKTLDGMDSPVIGKARCCKIEGLETQKWAESEWVAVEQKGISSHSMGGTWCPHGSYITGIDLDSCSGCDPMDSPVIGQVQCSKPAGNSIWGSTYWMDVGIQKSHQQQDWCLDGSFITQLDLDRAQGTDEYDSPIVGKAKCSCTRSESILMPVHVVAEPIIIQTPVEMVEQHKADSVEVQPQISGSDIERLTSFEENVNRPGLDYSTIALEGDNPDLCAETCRQDPQCKAFTYVKPGFQGDLAQCWLKNGIPDPAPDSCCVSGIVRE